MSNLQSRVRSKIHGANRPTYIKHACAHCRKAKSRCQGGSPCSECLRRGIHCSLNRQAEAPSPPPGGSDIPPSSAGRSWPGRRFLDLYFEKFHPHWLFVHRGSFDENIESPLLVHAMVVIGLWMSEEPNARSAAIDLHNTLASAISQQREAWDVSAAEDVGGASWPIPIYQGILLHIIFALMHAGNGNLGIDLRPSLSRTNTNLLNSLVGSCKRLGMLYYPNILARYSQSNPGSYIWLGIEETKRFNLALYGVYRAVSRVGQRTTDINNHTRLTVRDLQFPLPTHTLLWKAASKAEWDFAAVRGVFDHLLDNTMDEMWISKVNEALGVNWDLDYAP
ncbi:Zn(II)2Cys6 transcription factor [Aspergillus undulatus]|uniref:Zn(II)2Cys6 transcription factor n=1 Tax=Aspergillus undulatus TaxID=1810928 RepID=UPI003CCD9D0F